MKTITSMIRHDWVKCNDDVRQLSGVCSSWLRGRDPSMTLEAFRNLWCHRDTLASVRTVHNGMEDKLELVVHLSHQCCCFFFFFFLFGLQDSCPFLSSKKAFKDTGRT